MGEQRRLEAVACADLKNVLGTCESEGFNHLRHERGLGRHLAVGDRQRPVHIGHLDEVGRDELSSWHLAQGLKEARLVHTLGDNRLDEIFLAPHGIIMHRLKD